MLPVSSGWHLSRWAQRPGTARASTIIGPNVFTDTGVDTPGSGPRGNVDIAFAVNLPAGTYQATSFSSAYAAAGGDAQPFLAVVTAGTAGAGNETYTLIAVGADSTLPAFSSGTQMVTNPFGTISAGSDTFTLSVPTTVYAGFDNVASDNVITTDGGGATNLGNGPGTDAHFVNGPEGVTTVGATLVDTAAISQPNSNSLSTGGNNNTNTTYELTRRYDFSITVNTVPEPSSVVLCVLGAAGTVRGRPSPSPSLIQPTRLSFGAGGVSLRAARLCPLH